MPIDPLREAEQSDHVPPGHHANLAAELAREAAQWDRTQAPWLHAGSTLKHWADNGLAHARARPGTAMLLCAAGGALLYGALRWCVGAPRHR